MFFVGLRFEKIEVVPDFLQQWLRLLVDFVDDQLADRHVGTFNSICFECQVRVSDSESGFEEWGGSGFFGGDDFFGWTLGDDFAAGVSGFGADVEDPVGFGGDGHVVFDDDDGVAFVDEAVEDIDEAADVFVVEADGGFLDEVEVGDFEFEVGEAGFGAAAFDEFGDEFDALGLAA